MRQEELMPRVMELGRAIGLPKEVRREAKAGNWIDVFKKAGAKTWCERNRVHSSEIPELRNLPVYAPGAQIVLVAHRKEDDRWVTLVQVRNNGETDEDEKEIGFPGGACNLWEYNGKVASEHFVVAAYREFREEVGDDFYGPLDVLTIECTTNHYSGFADVYAPSVYYMREVPYSSIAHYSKCSGSEEGRIMVVPIRELCKYRRFKDAEKAFEEIIKIYAYRHRHRHICGIEETV